MKSIKQTLMSGAIMLALSIAFTSCDELIGELDNLAPSPVVPTETPSETTAATITKDPELTTSGIYAGSAIPLVIAGDVEGGTMMYAVTSTNSKPGSTDVFSVEVPTAVGFERGTYYVWYYAKGDATHKDSEMSATSIKVNINYSLSTTLTLEVLTDGTIKVWYPKTGMKYSKDGGANKTDITATTEIHVKAGDKVTFYGTAASYQNTGINNGTAQVKIYGNIMSLVSADFANADALTADNAFDSLFEGWVNLTDASGLLLPATTLTRFCYNGMFNKCDNLATAPELPAMTLKNNCYNSMFMDCTSLTTAPELKATTLANQCYTGMFYGCTSLTTAPEVLPAMTLTDNCYFGMFEGCTLLQKAPKLPASTSELKVYSYKEMFKGCTNLKEAWVKADYTVTGVGYEACAEMFDGCATTGTLHTATSSTAWATGTNLPSNWQISKDYDPAP